MYSRCSFLKKVFEKFVKNVYERFLQIDNFLMISKDLNSFSPLLQLIRRLEQMNLTNIRLEGISGT